MIFEHLTEKDKAKIEYYRTRYSNVEYSSCRSSDLSKVLREWDTQKERLFHLFGDKFIISQDIEYQEGEDEIWERLDTIMFGYDKDGNRELQRVIEDGYPWTSTWDLRDEADLIEARAKNYIHDAVNSLFCFRTLADNEFQWKVDGKTYIDIPLPNGDKLRAQSGMKPMKIIKKLAEAHGVGHLFENFRNDHSICLQTKSLKGNLSFSIHPLDYMTMSDNEHDWESCMSWRNEGEYRTGTLEMMNSPCVVVGYLSSDNVKMRLGDEGHWNSKKWRCLFIVDDNFIFSVKQYPYFNAGLCSLAVEKLAEAIGWNITEPAQEYDYYKARKGAVEYTSHGKKFVIDTSTNRMYNDCGSTTHYFIVNPEATQDLDNLYYCYSGEATCIACGDYLGGDWDMTHDCLTCSDIDEREDDCSCYCECGNRIYEDEGYWIGDDQVCDHCFERYGCYSELKGENYWREECKKVYLSKSKDSYACGNGEVFDWCPENYLDKECWSAQTTWSYSHWKGREDGYNGQIHYDEADEVYFIHHDDLTDYGLSMIFGIHNRDEWLGLTTPSQPQAPAPEIELPF